MAFAVRMIVTRAAAFVLLVLLPQLAAGSVLFENSILHNFQASGPVALTPGQNASVCVTNVDQSPVSILIGLLQADTGSLLAVREAALQPGEGTCLNFSRQSPQPNQPSEAGTNVVGIVVPNAHLSGQGAIVQDRPGGGCITASVQIQTVSPNNTAGQTQLYVPMQEHHERLQSRRDD
jgi:hypothetical protein